MAEEEDLGFTFDPTPFLKGLQNVTWGLTKVETTTDSVAKKMGGALSNFVVSGFAKVKGAIDHIVKKIKDMTGGLSKAGTTTEGSTKKMGGSFKDLTGGISKVEGATGNFAKKMGSVIMGAIVKIKLLGAAFRGVISTIKQYVPEIGQVFGIAKDVFFKNFLWPLRQALGPYLQKLLDWVRDNRAQFVKWGQTLANVFQVVVMAVKSLWNIGKQGWSVIETLIKSVTGGSVGDAVNLVITKLAVVVSFLSHAAEKVITWLKDIAPSLQPIVDAFAIIGKAVIDFSGGAFEGFMKVLNTTEFKTSIKELAVAFKNLVTELFGNGHDKDWKGIGETFGQITGGALKGSIDLVTGAIKLLTDSIKQFKEYWDLTFADIKNMGNLFSGKLSIEAFFKKQMINDKGVPVTALGRVIPGAVERNAQGNAVDAKGRELNDQGQLLGSKATVLKGSFTNQITIGNISIKISNNQKMMDKVLDDLTGAFRNKVQDAMIASGMHP